MRVAALTMSYNEPVCGRVCGRDITPVRLVLSTVSYWITDLTTGVRTGSTSTSSDWRVRRWTRKSERRVRE